MKKQRQLAIINTKKPKAIKPPDLAAMQAWLLKCTERRLKSGEVSPGKPDGKHQLLRARAIKELLDLAKLGRPFTVDGFRRRAFMAHVTAWKYITKSGYEVVGVTGDKRRKLLYGPVPRMATRRKAPRVEAK